MKASIEDTNFMDGMEQLLGFDSEKVEALLDELDADSLLALSDAIANQNKEAAEDIVGSFEDRLSSLFRGKDIASKEDKKKPVKPPKGHEFAIGDDVAIKTTNEDTGEDDFVSATVYKPKVPGGVAVKIDGKTQVVDKNDIYTLEELKEMVMGMVGIPNLQRMQKLAGIPGQNVDPQVTTEPAECPAPQPAMNTEMIEDMDEVANAIHALDTLESILPNLRLSDVKNIRQRMNAILSSINEGAKQGRTRKL